MFHYVLRHLIHFIRFPTFYQCVKQTQWALCDTKVLIRAAYTAVLINAEVYLLRLRQALHRLLEIVAEIHPLLVECNTGGLSKS